MPISVSQFRYVSGPPLVILQPSVAGFPTFTVTSPDFGTGSTSGLTSIFTVSLSCTGVCLAADTSQIYSPASFSSACLITIVLPFSVISTCTLLSSSSYSLSPRAIIWLPLFQIICKVPRLSTLQGSIMSSSSFTTNIWGSVTNVTAVGGNVVVVEVVVDVVVGVVVGVGVVVEG